MKKGLAVFLTIIMLLSIALVAGSIFAWYGENLASVAEIKDITTIKKDVPVTFNVEKAEDGDYTVTTIDSKEQRNIAPAKGFYPIMPKTMKGFLYKDGDKSNVWLVGRTDGADEINGKESGDNAIIGDGQRRYSQMTSVDIPKNTRTDRIYQPAINISNNSADGKTTALSCALFASKTVGGKTSQELIGYTDYNFGYASASGRSSMGTENLNPFVVKKGETVTLTLLTWVDAKKGSSANIYSRDKVEVYLEDYTKTVTVDGETYNKYYTADSAPVKSTVKVEAGLNEFGESRNFHADQSEAYRGDDGIAVAGSTMTRVPSYCLDNKIAYPVTGITGKFGGVRRIVIPQSVTTVIDGAMVGGSKDTLEEAILNGSCDIANNAFGPSSNSPLFTALKRVYIGTTMKKIGDNAFTACNKITDMILEGGTEFGAYVFRHTTFTSVSVPSTIQKMGSYVFRDNSGLRNVFIDVPQVGRQMLSYCRGLETITFGPSVTFIDAQVTEYCENVKSIIVGDNVTTVGSGGQPFLSCTAVTNLVLGQKLNAANIYDDSFKGMTLLESVRTPADAITEVMRGTKNALKNVEVTKGVIPSGTDTFKGNTSIANITIRDGVTGIAADAFSGCTGLERLNVADVGSWCNVNFGNANSNPLNQVNSKTQKRCELYVDDELVTDLIIPSTVTAINNYAFINCETLKSLTIPSSVSTVGAEAFTGCAIERVVAPSSVATEFNTEALTNLEIIDKAVLPANAFDKAVNLKTVKIAEADYANNRSTVDDNAFIGCPIETAVIPGEALKAMPTATVVNLTLTSGATPDNTFANANNLKYLRIERAVTKIGVGSLENCSRNIESLAISANHLVGETSDVFGRNPIDKFYNPDGKFKYLEIIDDLENKTEAKDEKGNTIIGKDGKPVMVVQQTEILAENINKIEAHNQSTGLVTIKIGDYTKIKGTIDTTKLRNLKTAIVSGGKIDEILRATNKADGTSSIENIEVVSGTIRQRSEEVLSTGLSYWNVQNGTLSIADGVVVDDRAFEGCNAKIVTAVVPANAINPMLNYDGYIQSRDSLAKITVTSGNIPDKAFNKCTALRNVYVNDKVTGAGENAFVLAQGLVAFNESNGINYLGDEAGNNLHYLAVDVINEGATEVILHNDCKYVEEYAFARLSSLTTVVIPDTTKVTDNAFYQSYNIETITAPASALGAIPKRVWEIDGEVFSGNMALKTATITSGSVSREIFAGFSALTTVTVKDKVVTINGYAFRGCSALNSVTFENGGNVGLSIGRFAFDGCTALKNSGAVSFGTKGITWRNGDDIWSTTADGRENAKLLTETYVGKTWRKDGA